MSAIEVAYRQPTDVRISVPFAVESECFFFFFVFGFSRYFAVKHQSTNGDRFDLRFVEWVLLDNCAGILASMRSPSDLKVMALSVPKDASCNENNRKTYFRRNLVVLALHKIRVLTQGAAPVFAKHV